MRDYLFDNIDRPWPDRVSREFEEFEVIFVRTTGRDYAQSILGGQVGEFTDD